TGSSWRKEERPTARNPARRIAARPGLTEQRTDATLSSTRSASLTSYSSSLTPPSKGSARGKENTNPFVTWPRDPKEKSFFLSGAGRLMLEYQAFDVHRIR